MKKYLQTVVILIVCASLAYVAQKYWNRISGYHWNLPVLLSVFIPVFVAVKFILSIIGGLLLKRIKIDITIWEGAKICIKSAPTRYVPGKLWPFVSKIYLGQAKGVLKGHMAVGTVMEVLLLLASAVFVFFSLLPFSGEFAGTIIHSDYLLVIIIALIIPLISIHPKIISFAIKRFTRKNRSISMGPVENIGYRNVFSVFLCLGLYWIIFGSAVFFIIDWVIPLPPDFFPTIIGANAIAWVIGYLSIIAPSGIGVREGVMVWLLRKSLPVPDLTIIVFLIRFLLILADIILAAIVFIPEKFVYFKSD